MPVYPGKGKASNLGSSFPGRWPSPDTNGRKCRVVLVFQWQSRWGCEILTALLGFLEQLQKPVLFHPPCQPLTVLAVLLTSLGVTKGNFSVSCFFWGLAEGVVNWILLKERAWRNVKMGNICSSLPQGQAVQPCLDMLLCQGQKRTTGVTLSSWPCVAHQDFPELVC